jgi:hypothetical protein
MVRKANELSNIWYIVLMLENPLGREWLAQLLVGPIRASLEAHVTGIYIPPKPVQVKYGIDDVLADMRRTRFERRVQRVLSAGVKHPYSD